MVPVVSEKVEVVENAFIYGESFSSEKMLLVFI